MPTPEEEFDPLGILESYLNCLVPGFRNPHKCFRERALFLQTQYIGGIALRPWEIELGLQSFKLFRLRDGKAGLT